ncbi:uncharacterized protein ASCRUDRAFT_83321 [Ascoidea rubescens DSM 1968]|uniref:Uncharacterized protein n=1 Tax=Ascoidea rubescens DSM 1968 TaxID=1344418 RepID=A0A1D2VP30_9ASCO|nr:hypothetical protein ASCRUDRAFT_83321 [Ascoidea rubescens DSM 1968]ODV63356.1 hypothetical protein ASCRUDRAFT_83321 [Ascoidea rubescens DSM 1968]
MFKSRLNLFRNVPCPAQNCTLVNCLFYHGDTALIEHNQPDEIEGIKIKKQNYWVEELNEVTERRKKVDQKIKLLNLQKKLAAQATDSVSASDSPKRPLPIDSKSDTNNPQHKNEKKLKLSKPVPDAKFLTPRNILPVGPAPVDIRLNLLKLLHKYYIILNPDCKNPNTICIEKEYEYATKYKSSKLSYLNEFKAYIFQLSKKINQNKKK